MLDRTKRPELKVTGHIDFVEPKRYHLSGDVSLFHMSQVMNETCRIDLYFDAGKIHGDSGMASFVNGLLLSGTKTKSAVVIQESINSTGAFYESGVAMENAVVSIYCLREKAIELVSIITECIREVVFDEKEVREYLTDQKQGHRIAMKKVSHLARREFQKSLFHSDPRYGKVIEEEDFDDVKTEDLRDFHANHYLHGLRRVAVVGNLDEAEINAIISEVKPFVSNRTLQAASDIINEKGPKHVERTDALQSAIRIGRILFNKNHEDYLDFLILNTILGDYFGSRLMANIREDKGYTYGIGSAIAELAETGYFVIAAEVGKGVREAAIEEVRRELERLRNEMVLPDELELVRNYMMGQLLKSADGPYALMDLFLSAEINGCDLELYNRAIASIDNITPERILELADKYLKWEDMSVISAG